MATDGQAAAAGFAIPQGDDPIHNGDDAIRQNARVAYELATTPHTKVENTSGSFQMDSAGGVQLFVNGERVWWVNSDGVMVEGSVRRLDNALGSIQIDSAGGVQHFVNGTRVWWVNYLGELTQGTVPWDHVTGAPPASSPAGLKVAPLALTVGQSTWQHNDLRSIRIPVRFNAPIVRWRLHMRNWNPRLGTVTAAPVNVTGLWLADTPGDGAITGTPTQLRPAFATPANGDEWVSAWFDAPIGEDVERLLCFGYTTPTKPPGLIGGSYQHPDPAQAIGEAGHAANNITPFDLWIEAETPATTPVIAAIGDSQSAGTGSTLPVYDSWLSQYTREYGALPMHVTYHGDSMNGFRIVNPGKATRWSSLARADAVVWALGGNDIGDGRTIAQMRTDFDALRPVIEAAVGPVGYAVPVLPRNSWNADKETQRVDWSNWVTTRPGIRGVLDFASVVSADGDTIRPEYDSGDGTHLTTAGYKAAADSITTPLTAPGYVAMKL